MFIAFQKTTIILFAILIAVPLFAIANGGDQRVVDGKYLINLSRSPFTPRVGVATSMIASFVDIAKDKLIAEDLIVRVRITKLGGVGTNKRTFLFEKEKIPVKGGILELPYTFTESGLHEIFFDFTFTSNQEKTYNAPDFLVDIQGKASNLDSIAGIILGFIFGLWLGRHTHARR